MSGLLRWGKDTWRTVAKGGSTPPAMYCGAARPGKAWHSVAGIGNAWPGVDWQGEDIRCWQAGTFEPSRRIWHGSARNGAAGPGNAWRGNARRGWAR